jgi:hypothetical protein
MRLQQRINSFIDHLTLMKQRKHQTCESSTIDVTRSFGGSWLARLDSGKAPPAQQGQPLYHNTYQQPQPHRRQNKRDTHASSVRSTDWHYATMTTSHDAHQEQSTYRQHNVDMTDCDDRLLVTVLKQPDHEPPISMTMSSSSDYDSGSSSRRTHIRTNPWLAKGKRCGHTTP